jgi:hypothetical protein
MRVIGLGHHTRALAGSGRVMTASSSLLVTGREMKAGWTMITTQTATELGTSVTATRIVTRITIRMTTRVGAATANHTPQRTTAGAHRMAPAALITSASQYLINGIIGHWTSESTET